MSLLAACQHEGRHPFDADLDAAVPIAPLPPRELEEASLVQGRRNAAIDRHLRTLESSATTCGKEGELPWPRRRECVHVAENHGAIHEALQFTAFEFVDALCQGRRVPRTVLESWRGLNLQGEVREQALAGWRVVGELSVVVGVQGEGAHGGAIERHLLDPSRLALQHALDRQGAFWHMLLVHRQPKKPLHLNLVVLILVLFVIRRYPTQPDRTNHINGQALWLHWTVLLHDIARTIVQQAGRHATDLNLHSAALALAPQSDAPILVQRIGGLAVQSDLGLLEAAAAARCAQLEVQRRRRQRPIITDHDGALEHAFHLATFQLEAPLVERRGIPGVVNEPLLVAHAELQRREQAIRTKNTGMFSVDNLARPLCLHPIG
mmetsp:Transcript_75242/g.209189  ORF Transcript_75242/g.209189 Transcript_75242/m.209189 type:complete len:378 (-) Transcript_75242:156-1289(-)